MQSILRKLGIESVNKGGFDGQWFGSGDRLDSVSPIDGKVIGSVTQVTPDEYDRIAARAHAAFLKWRSVPAPVRGETVRRLGNALRCARDITDAACFLSDAGDSRVVQALRDGVVNRLFVGRD